MPDATPVIAHSTAAHHSTILASHSRCARIIVSVALCVATGASSEAQAESLIATESRATAVSAYDGRIVWSSYVPARRHFRLATWSGSRKELLPVAPRSRPFDVDVGPDVRGEVVAVYSRCRREPSRSFSRNGLPTYSTGRGCDVFLYDFASREEHKVDGVSSSRASEFLPSIWKDRIVFGRVFEKRRGRAGVLPYVFAGHPSGDRSAQMIPGGSRGLYERDTGGPGPVSIDMRGTRVAAVWNLERTSCPGEPGDDAGFGSRESQVWLVELPRTRQLVDRGCTGGENDYFFSPFFSGAQLFYYRRQNAPDPLASHLRSFNLTTNGLSDEPIAANTLAVASDGNSRIFSRRLDSRPPRFGIIADP